jgi:hypothetical protein
MSNNKTGEKVYHYPLVALNMTDRDVVERASLLFETSVYANRPYGVSKLPGFRVVATGQNAAEIMQAILPFMGRRRSEKINEVLAEWSRRIPTAERRRTSCSKAAAKRKRDCAGKFRKR